MTINRKPVINFHSAELIKNEIDSSPKFILSDRCPRDRDQTPSFDILLQLPSVVLLWLSFDTSQKSCNKKVSKSFNGFIYLFIKNRK